MSRWSPPFATRLLFALGLAVILFDGEVNAIMMFGSSLIIGSGIIMMVSGGLREAYHKP